MRLFSGTIGHNKPSPKKNMFQNYVDHLSYIEIESIKIWRRLDHSSPLSVLIGENVKRIRVFEALRDGHDYFDEVLGAFVGSTLCTAAAMALMAYSTWEMGAALLMKTRAIKNDGENHWHNAVKGVFCAMTLVVMSLFIHVKSMISLITRPLITLLAGYNKQQDVDRFYDNDSQEPVHVVHSHPGSSGGMGINLA